MFVITATMKRQVTCSAPVNIAVIKYCMRWATYFWVFFIHSIALSPSLFNSLLDIIFRWKWYCWSFSNFVLASCTVCALESVLKRVNLRFNLFLWTNTNYSSVISATGGKRDEELILPINSSLSARYDVGYLFMKGIKVLCSFRNSMHFRTKKDTLMCFVSGYADHNFNGFTHYINYQSSPR